MKQTPNYSPMNTVPATAAQEAYMAIEEKPRDRAEKRLLEQARAYVQAHAHQADLRDLAPAVRELMGAGYQVGSGGSHVWIKRAPAGSAPAAPPRLAIIADRLTTAYRDWFEPKLPTGPRPSSRPEQGLPIPNQFPITTSPATR